MDPHSPQAIIERYRTFLLYMLDTLHDAPGVQEMRDMIPELQWVPLQPEIAHRWGCHIAIDIGGLPLRIFYKENKGRSRTVREPLSIFTRRGPKNSSVPIGEAAIRQWKNLENEQGGMGAEVALTVSNARQRWTVRLPTHVCFPLFIRTRGLRDNAHDKVDERWGFSDKPNEVNFVSDGESWTFIQPLSISGPYTTSETPVKDQVRVNTNDLGDGNPSSPTSTILHLEFNGCRAILFIGIDQVRGRSQPYRPPAPIPPPSQPPAVTLSGIREALHFAPEISPWTPVQGPIPIANPHHPLYSQSSRHLQHPKHLQQPQHFQNPQPPQASGHPLPQQPQHSHYPSYSQLPQQPYHPYHPNHPHPPFPHQQNPHGGSGSYSLSHRQKRIYREDFAGVSR